MVSKKDVDYYCGYSRKELQSLCKKYKLPANRSSLDMAESLASFFELQKNSLNSVGVGFGVAGNRAGLATTSKAPVKRDFYGKELNTERGNRFQGAVAREPGVIIGERTKYQARNGGLIGSECVPPYTRKLNGKGPTEPRLHSGDRPSSSSFEFHVSSEEGISLSVDLNFNPLDWSKSMRGEVNVHDSLRRRKPPHSDIAIDNATICKKQKSLGEDKDGYVRRETPMSSAMMDNTQVLSDHHSNGELSLASSGIQPCSRTIEGSDTCKGKKALNSSLPDSAGPGQIVSSCVESYSKSRSVNPLDVDCVNPHGKKLSSDSVVGVAAVQNRPAGDLLIEVPETPSMESFQKVGNSSTVICPRGPGSELSSSEAEAYYSNPPCSPRNISSSQLIIDGECASYSESFKLRYNGGKNCLPPNNEEQEKSEVLSEQARSE
ncbi:unnamed protein product [Thlaspi arvense]|uniref:Uncharacterized protein n=1 Tax=Thlaspi arvense TaxID=13288 RepID=A0AAU9SCF9_THLAR|nr:unnamed protein product [Thlaspi arvense]